MDDDAFIKTLMDEQEAKRSKRVPELARAQLELLQEQIDSNIVWKPCSCHVSLQIIKHIQACQLCGAYSKDMTNLCIISKTSKQGHSDYAFVEYYHTGEIGLPFPLCAPACLNKLQLFLTTLVRLDPVHLEPTLTVKELQRMVLDYLYTAIVVCPFCPPATS